MKITNVQVTKYEFGKTLALASITIEDQFVISGLKVLDGKNGLWVAMPNYKAKNGEYQDIAFPITKEAREIVQTAVLSKYHSILEKEQEQHYQAPVKDVSTAEDERTAAYLDVTEDSLPF